MLPTDPTPRPPASARTPRLEEIVAAAFSILDAEGAAALTMRTLASTIGIQAPSLYKHVPDKAHLEAALIEDIFFAIGDVLHDALAEPGDGGALRSLLASYRQHSLAQPNRYRLATSGRLRRDLLPDCLEEWAGQPFFFAAGGNPHRSQALWSFAHGMVILEIDGRYPDGSDLDRTWEAGAAAFDR
jgi:AcrR family transcriptional regulator